MSDYLIESILPCREVHLVGGPSGSGKTTLLLDMLKTWSAGQSVFGHASHPCPFVYFSCDRSEPGMIRTFARMGVSPADVRLVSGVERGILTIDQVFAVAKRDHPDAHLLIIEGFAGLVPGTNKQNDYGSVAKFLGKCTRWCQENDKTIIGVVHSAKTKENERYLNPRQRVLGSVAWAAFAETIIVVEPQEESNPDNPVRELLILPRNAKEQKFHLMFNGAGRLEELKRAASGGAKGQKFEQFLDSLGDGEEFTTADAIAATEATKKHVISWLKTAEGAGRLIKTGKGRFCVTTSAALASDALDTPTY